MGEVDEVAQLMRECTLAARLNPDRMTHNEQCTLYGRGISLRRDVELRREPFQLSAYQRRRLCDWVDSKSRASLETRLLLIGQYVRTKDFAIPPEFAILKAIGRRAGVTAERLDAAMIGAVWLGHGEEILRILTKRAPTYDAVYKAFGAEALRLRNLAM